ncbi:reductive dehalogenase [Dehalogenimonas etheniformans]|uniref:Reductive dehalogenase n=1 Tax=Dehalogenimonas etheniformans TaxID=1536648 RepID=A0A2P5P622_9CHLR|nr:reductive dehalogenase [Dehalogenimonas etheniformans]PPD57730.1 reductive dehalogenase [Dehalogenimonas etheniformans]QNT76070.1 reductive dehalogenase [Dehalogenimonas etheniformans]
MQKFHSTVSRRDFMKFMGITAAGLGAAGLVAPAFHDLDELAASTKGNQRRPWYVKEREFYNPTVETDWAVMQRRDPTNTGQQTEMWAKYYGQKRADEASAKGAANVKQWTANKEPGFTYRALALQKSVTRGWPAYVSLGWGGPTTNGTWTKGGGKAYTGVQSPEERGEAKWTGTPEENSQLMNAFMRYCGNAISGYGPLDTDSREYKQIISTNIKHNAAQKVVFEDVPAGYETSTKRVIPTSHQYYLVNWEMMSHDLSRTTPAQGGLFNSSDHVATILKPSTFNFLRYLGYGYVGGGSDDGTPFVEGASAILTGVCEGSRNNVFSLTPEYGPIGRLHNYVTNLPLAATKPIDAGMFKFCYTCGKCANNCPSGSISTASEPTWEIPDINGIPSTMHNRGTKEFWSDGALCRMWRTEYGTSCNKCWGECTFTTNSRAMVHSMIKTTIATASISPLNSFFAKMGDTFGYGTDDQKAEEWWDYSLPILGFDSTVVAFDGGYRKTL